MKPVLTAIARASCRALSLVESRWLAAALCVVILASAAPAGAHEAKLPEVSAELEALRAKLAKYKDPMAAIRDGYFSTLTCVQYPDGAMGVHFFNASLIGPTPDPDKPQVLMYEPVGGKLRLIAVEWLVPLATGIEEAPRLFERTFHGPMPGHYPVMPKGLRHYDMHVWLFKENPNGLFYGANPTVNCVGKWPYVVEEAHRSDAPME